MPGTTANGPTAIYRLGHHLGRFCFGTFGRMRVTGLENVPPRGPVILACNHLAFTDPPLLVAAIPRPLYFLGKKELFGNPVGAFLMRGFHVSPYDRATIGADTMRIMLAHLERDRAVVIFPEGTRSPHHALQWAMPGIVYLALRSQAPILPVGITGTQKIRAWRMPVPLCQLNASIGPPFTLPIIEGRAPRPVMDSMLRMVMERVARQLPPEFRGVYAVPPPETPPETPMQTPNP